MSAEQNFEAYKYKLFFYNVFLSILSLLSGISWHDFESNPLCLLIRFIFPFLFFRPLKKSFPLLSFSFFYRLFGSHVFLKTFYYLYLFTTYMCVSMRTPGCYSTCGGPRTTCRDQFTPSTAWLTETELVSSGLVASAFPGRVIWPAW